MKLWIAALAAVLVQPLVFLLRIAPSYLDSPQPLYGLGFSLLAVLLVGAVAVLILGVPAFLLLRKYRYDSWVTVPVAGLLLGMLPMSWSLPHRLEGFSAGENWHGKYVDTYINGVPTTYAWLTYGESAVFFAIHGLVGASVFYAIWRWRRLPSMRWSGP